MYEEETTLWAGGPSHVRDFGYYVFCVLFAWMIFPIGMAVWRYLATRCERYEISNERIRVTKGILSKRMDELELYRVKDTSLEQPFFLRLFKLSNLIIKTSDLSTPRIVVAAIPEAKVLRENLRGCIEKIRATKGVREVDYR